jgi:hypothetical protein
LQIFGAIDCKFKSLCPFEGHPVKPQTLFKSFKKAGNRLLGQIGDATPMRTGKHQVTSQYAHGP